MNPFIDLLKENIELPEGLQERLNHFTIHRRFRKNVRLISSGAVCKELYFLKKGLARVFYYKDGKDVTACFVFENQVVSAVDSLLSGTPTAYNIELLENSEVYSLPLRKIESLYEEYPVVLRLPLALTTKSYLFLDERVKTFASCGAEERYQIMLVQLPDIFNRVKLGHIASYIGISQEHLSRLRSNYKQQKKQQQRF
ncbi:Crp/Fnr family transcriptional regulator [Dyadobacter sp.]|uniref:Crp/Fnr family transcriptional regulator n=1 Tax=Dyadobacter sp. TaxID=1914288 RepID=UPI003F70F768